MGDAAADMSRMCSSYDKFSQGISRDLQHYGQALTHEGMLAHHGVQFVDDDATSKREDGEQLVRPVFKAASSRNPLSGRMEYFLGVGLQPCISEEELVARRHPLCVVFLVDVCGAMAQAYDFLTDRRLTKLDVAKQLVDFIAKNLLRPEDCYSVVTYRSSHDSKTPHDSAVVGLEELAKAQGFGGGNMEAAMSRAQEEMLALVSRQSKGGLFKGRAGEMSQRYIVLTDQTPPAELRSRGRPRVYYGFDDN